MLWHKTWLDTRGRFITGLLLALVVTTSNVYEYVAIRQLLPLAESMSLPSGPAAGLAAAIREAVELQREFGGFIWYRVFRDNLLLFGLLFAVLLGCGGPLTEVRKGSALFTLSLPVTRRRLFGTRAALGLAQCAAITILPALVVTLLAPAIGQAFSPVDALAHGLCLFVVAGLFFALTSLLSSMFEGIWKPLLIALAVACVALMVQLVLPDAGVFRVMSGERYFRDGTLPWAGLLTSAVLAMAFLYGAAETLERHDF
jgi:ABC-type transport system involved in multi-copper enzyme maturation permease subunit